MSAYLHAPFTLLTLDPGHFHAALVQKSMVPDVDPLVHVYAPDRADLDEHLKRIERFNARADRPTAWQTKLHFGQDYFQKLLEERSGNIVVIAGNNRRKADYILQCTQAGLNVLADKPMAIVPDDLPKLQYAFAIAREKNVLLYDIMTERFEITTILQRELSQQKELFGELVSGTPDNPAIIKESVHHFSKTVAGVPLKRAPWVFDVKQAGEGIVDVTTHLVDLIQWEAFPEQALSPADVTMLRARRWMTMISREQFHHVTGLTNFPGYLKDSLVAEVLPVCCNGEFVYRVRNVHAKVSAIWNFQAAPGAGDTHYSMMRGSRANLEIKQGPDEGFKPVLRVEQVDDSLAANFQERLRVAVDALQPQFPGVCVARDAAMWRIQIPEQYHVGHEEHFGQVTEHFLRCLRAGALPDWEVPNMLTKYATIMQAYEMSR